MNHSVKILLFLCVLAMFFTSCKKDNNNLYGISINPSSLVGTEAEAFTIQQLRMFSASNTNVAYMMQNSFADTIRNNICFSPIYLINNLLLDTSLSNWTKAYTNNYALKFNNHNALINCINSMQNTIKEIDSSLYIFTKIDSINENHINISEQISIEMKYMLKENNDFDNIFTNISGDKPRIDFIEISDSISFYSSDDERVVEIPTNNGAYNLMLFMPTDKDIMRYIKTFDEEKYISIIQSLHERQISVTMPLIGINNSNFTLSIPSFVYNDSTISLDKKININSSFQIRQHLASTQVTGVSMQAKPSETIKYNSPFMFILRGRNTNAIMFIGLYLTAK